MIDLATVQAKRRAEVARFPSSSDRADATRQPAARIEGLSPSTFFAWFAVVVALAAPLPFGSNRPVFWMFWASVIGLGFALFMGISALSHPQRALRIRSFVPLIAIALVQPSWGIVQLLPLGDWGRWLSYQADLPHSLKTASISIAPGATMLAVIRMTAHVLLFALVIETATRLGRIALMMRVIFGGVVVYAVWGMVNLVMLGDAAPFGVKTAYPGMATGPFVNRNSFASFLGMGLIVGVALLLEPRAGAARREGAARAVATLTLGISCVLILAALLATQSRLGLVASLAGATVTAVAMKRGAPGRRTSGPGGRIMALMGVMLFISALASFGLPTLERLIFSTADLQARLAIYSEALARIVERPLTGYGLDSFPLAFSVGRADAHFNDLIYTDAHSTYLENWVEGGLIAGSAPVLAGALAGLRLIRSLAGNGMRAAPAAACGALVLAALHSTLDFPFEIEANVLLLVVLVALGLAQPRNGQTG